MWWTTGYGDARMLSIILGLIETEYWYMCPHIDFTEILVTVAHAPPLLHVYIACTSTACQTRDQLMPAFLIAHAKHSDFKAGRIHWNGGGLFSFATYIAQLWSGCMHTEQPGSVLQRKSHG